MKTTVIAALVAMMCVGVVRAQKPNVVIIYGDDVGIGDVGFGEQGMWDEAGSFYKEMPPQVNAAAPPLQWQTYDVEVDLPENPNTHDRALITVRLNGILVHNRHERHVGNAPLVVMLEDHINRMQFRNIWIEQ